jgi:hypothetical protein
MIRLTKTQLGLLDYLVRNEGRALISGGYRTLRIGFDRETREPLACCNWVSIYFLTQRGWIEPVPSNIRGRYAITMQGRVVRCRERYRSRRKNGFKPVQITR